MPFGPIWVWLGRLRCGGGAPGDRRSGFSGLGWQCRWLACCNVAAGLYGPDLGPTGPVWAWLSLRLHPVGYRRWWWRLFPPACYYTIALAGVPSFLSCWPRNMVHGETTMVIARPWWRVGGWQAWWSTLDRSGCGFLGVGRNPCHLNTDAVMLAGVAFPS
jgi:hypothetical protein